MEMIEYEQQDYDTAKEIISKGFLMDLDKNTLELTETNIVDIAKKYYTLRHSIQQLAIIYEIIISFITSISLNGYGIL